MIKWIRPSGSEIETNDSEATIKDCEAMGWKRKKSIVEKVIDKPKATKKAAKKDK